MASVFSLLILILEVLSFQCLGDLHFLNSLLLCKDLPHFPSWLYPHPRAALCLFAPHFPTLLPPLEGCSPPWPQASISMCWAAQHCSWGAQHLLSKFSASGILLVLRLPRQTAPRLFLCANHRIEMLISRSRWCLQHSKITISSFPSTLLLLR